VKTLKKVPIRWQKIEGDQCLPEVKDMEFGVLYTSWHFKASSHLCLCGCGVQCFLPIGAKFEPTWELWEGKNGTISMTPSILQRFECKSHYIITDGVANFV